MTIAGSIGSYRLCEFVELNICQCRVCFGDIPILVVDDPSPETERIKAMCQQRGVTFLPSRAKRGHFAGDMFNCVNAIAFARANDCDIAIKLSQRFIFRLPACRDVIEETFADQTVFASPGRMNPRTVRLGGTAMFSAMPTLTDLMLFRASAVDPQLLIETYRQKCESERHLRWGQWVESVACDWHDKTFKGRSRKVEAFTNPVPGQPPIYLRRNQHPKELYLELARQHDIRGAFELGEWRTLEASYNPLPMLI